MTEASRLVVVNEWTGKYQINEYYRPIAEGLTAKFQELRHIMPKGILFIDNKESKGQNQGRIRLAQVRKVTGQVVAGHISTNQQDLRIPNGIF